MTFPDDSSRQAFLDHFVAELMSLPLEEQPAAIHRLVALALETLPIEAIMEMRKQIVAAFSQDIPIVSSTLDLIEGHLSLRALREEGLS